MERLRQEDHKVSEGYILRLCFKYQTQSQTEWKRGKEGRKKEEKERETKSWGTGEEGEESTVLNSAVLAHWLRTKSTRWLALQDRTQERDRKKVKET